MLCGNRNSNGHRNTIHVIGQNKKDVIIYNYVFHDNAISKIIKSRKGYFRRSYGTRGNNPFLDIFWILHYHERHIVTVCVFVCHVFSYHPLYFYFHSARIIFDVSSGFYLWNVNRTPTWHLSKMFKVAFKDVSTYWTILFVMLKIYFIYKVAGKKSRRAI